MKEHIELEQIQPADIEARSFEIITQELGDRVLDPMQAPIIKRCIHTTADFSYADNLCFSRDVVSIAREALQNGCTIVTDTNMAYAGINKRKLAEYGCEIHCYMADEDVAREAKERKVTRAIVSMERAAKLPGKVAFVIGNAPTALIHLYEMIGNGQLSPAFIVGAPVGFVNVVQSKELIMQTDIPYIVARGRKGGSNVAAAIINALLYMHR